MFRESPQGTLPATQNNEFSSLASQVDDGSRVTEAARITRSLTVIRLQSNKCLTNDRLPWEFDDDLWLFCRAEVNPSRPMAATTCHQPAICIADIRGMLVMLARSGVLTDVYSHACLRAASLLVQLRAAIFMRPYDPKVPVSDVEAVAAYKKLREMLYGE